ncbi:MAG: DUF3500 domain-containing protein [Luteitalea sp.]|nr:DUF3500 domain-containing protein [Luteitalea sp.]
MATAATDFLDGLSPEQRQQATLPFDGDERMRWHFVPTQQFPRKGLPIKAMTEPQRKLAHGLLEAGLSARGYLTATAIMDLETVLKALEKRGRMIRDPELYFFSVFGTPSAKGPWGWRVEGHHVSLHFTIVNGTAVAASPSFFGSNPAEVREGPKKGLRILGKEEDTARELLLALDESQRATAVIADVAPNEIVTGTAAEVDPLSPVGLTASAMTSEQRDLLMQIIDVYTSYMADDARAERMTELREAGIDKIAFAWSGEAERGKKHYYRIQGPTFLIEYDNSQNDGNHVHTVWRDFDGDFGRDLLREHVQAVAH